MKMFLIRTEEASWISGETVSQLLQIQLPNPNTKRLYWVFFLMFFFFFKDSYEKLSVEDLEM